MENHLAYQVQQLLTNNKIPFDKEELAFQIKSHPSFPSLHAVTGVLDHFNVDNLALDVPVDEETLEQLPQSFLVQIQIDEHKEFAIINKQEDKIDITISPKKKLKLSIPEFLKKFTGIMVAVEKDENQTDIPVSNTLLKKVLIGSMLVAGIALIATSSPNLFTLAYSIFSLLGVYVSLSIIKQDFGIRSALSNAICSQETENNGCEAVLTSDGGTLFGTFKLSDLSLVYFVSQFVIAFIFLLQRDTPVLLHLISFIALPITLYSIYYQYAVAKSWCALCLSIVFILWVQAGLAIPFANSSMLSSITSSTLLIVALVFLAATTIWHFLSPEIKKFQELKQSKVDFYKFKKNYSIFSSLLRKSTTIDTTIPETQEIVFGSNDSPLSLVIVTNPFCKHCRQAHQLVENLLKTYSEYLKITIRFNIDLTDPNSELVRISSRLLELYDTRGMSACLEGMDDIYGGQAPEDWLKKWGNTAMPEHYYEVLKKEYDWCINSNINFTPEILIDGKSFPMEYNRSDLIYFIEDLSENAMNSINNSTPNFE